MKISDTSGDTRFCSACKVKSDVIDSRSGPDGGVRRRRKCPLCGIRWTTYEFQRADDGAHVTAPFPGMVNAMTTIACLLCESDRREILGRIGETLPPATAETTPPVGDADAENAPGSGAAQADVGSKDRTCNQTSAA